MWNDDGSFNNLIRSSRQRKIDAHPPVAGRESLAVAAVGLRHDAGARPGEVEGVHYYFRTKEAFQAAISANEFLEWAEVFGNYYGTPASEVEPYRKQGIGVLLDIDVNGWMQVRRRCPDVVSIFVQTSSMATYEKRLRARKTETEASLHAPHRGGQAGNRPRPEYDYRVINDDLDTALASLRAILGPLFERKNHAG